MGARISSMIRKSINNEQLKTNDKIDFSLLISDSEWDLIKIIAEYPAAVMEAASNLDPSHLAGFLYELSKAFSRFYHECPILNCEDIALSKARLELSRAVMLVLKDAFNLVCIPFMEIM